MAKKSITNKQKELIYSILPNLSVEKIEQVIKLLLDKKTDEVKKILKKEKKELVDEILKINLQELESNDYKPDKEIETKHFTNDGYKKIEVLEKKIENTEPITQENFNKHPAHFKYVAYLLNQLEEKYNESDLRLKLRKTFLGEEYEGQTTQHKVRMFKEYPGDKKLEQYLEKNPQMLRNNFNDEELIKISNSLIASLRDYYYGEFLGLKNYMDYVLKDSDSKTEKKKKIRQLKYLDAAITSRQGEFGVSNEQIFNNLKQLQEQKMPFGGETILDHIDKHIFSPILEHHKQETKQKVLNTFLTNKNFHQFQHFMNDHVNKNPDIPELHKEQIRKLYHEKNLDAAKQNFAYFVPKGMANYNIAEKEEFETMRDMYSRYNKKEKDKHKHYMKYPDEKTAKQYE